MSNNQLWLAIGIPSFLILVGMFQNNTRFNAIEARLIAIENDLRRFYEILGRHGEAIDTLKERIK